MRSWCFLFLVSNATKCKGGTDVEPIVFETAQDPAAAAATLEGQGRVKIVSLGKNKAQLQQGFARRGIQVACYVSLDLLRLDMNVGRGGGRILQAVRHIFLPKYWQ